MGFRTLLGLSNDTAHEWQHDAELGNKIWTAASQLDYPGANPLGRGHFEYGSIIEVVHADTESLILGENYTGTVIHHSFWHRNEPKEDQQARILKEFADRLGYNISKKRAKVTA